MAYTHLVLEAKIPGRRAVRIKVPAATYRRADARDINGKLRTAQANTGARKFICMKVKEKFRKDFGVNPGFVKWETLVLSVAAHLNEGADEPMPYDVWRMKVARNLQLALDQHEERLRAEKHSSQNTHDEVLNRSPVAHVDDILELIDDGLRGVDEPLTLFEEIVTEKWDEDYVYNPCGCVPFPITKE